MRYLELIERVEIINLDSVHDRRGQSHGSNRGTRLKLYVNPSSRDLANLSRVSGHRIRFSVADDGSLYMWSAYNAIHHDVLHHAGIEEKYGGYVEPGVIAVRRDQSPREMGPILRSNPRILDLMGGVNFRVIRNTEEIDDW